MKKIMHFATLFAPAFLNLSIPALAADIAWTDWIKTKTEPSAGVDGTIQLFGTSIETDYRGEAEFDQTDGGTNYWTRNYICRVPLKNHSFPPGKGKVEWTVNNEECCVVEVTVK